MTITAYTYHEHPLIENVKTAFKLADENTSEISDFAMRIPGMSGRKYRQFINNYVRSLPNARYLEVGTWLGSTLCSAIDGIDNIEAVAIDNFSYGGATMEQVIDHVTNTCKDLDKITVLDQRFEDFDFTAHGKFNVYLYDGAHGEEDQYLGIVRAKPALADVALIVVDDWNKGSGGNNGVQDGTYRGLNDAGLEVMYKIDIDTGITDGAGGGVASDWHCGYGIFLVRHK